MACWVYLLLGQVAAIRDCLEMNEDIFTSIIRRYVTLGKLSSVIVLDALP